MARQRKAARVAQAWIELRADDPEAVSALAVARACLAAGARLGGLRRLRLMEIRGPLPGREEIETLLHHSTQFYNPHKERCALRLAESEPSPMSAAERAVLVVERDADRRLAAERWWRHETGEEVEVREGVVWVASFTGAAASKQMQDLALVRDRRQGLLCNPHSQRYRLVEDEVPIPWLDEESKGTGGAGPVRRRKKER